MEQPVIWIVGDWQQLEFAAAVEKVRSRAKCQVFDSVTAACDALGASGAPAPRALLLVQSRPGQIPQAEVKRLRAAAPSARFLVLVGPWCEGEAPNDEAWVGVVRVPWRAWETRLLCELGLAGQEEAVPRGLPRTTVEANRLEWMAAQVRSGQRNRGVAAIFTNSRVTYESLAGALKALGVRAMWQFGAQQTRRASIDLVLIDGWENVPANPAAEKASTKEQLPRRILLLHFPRPQDASRAGTLGIDRVIAQPLLLSDLAATLATLPPKATAGGKRGAAA
jgi:hypothetical protein